jgi:oligoribonuclease
VTNERVLFLDTETTGLSPQFCSVLEVAAVVVDAQLTQHAAYEAVVFHKADRINPEMDAYVHDMHTRSGLLQEVERSPFDLKSVDERLHNFIQTNFPDGQKPMLAGNSVHFDLSFIKQHMPRTAGLLSHRLVDASGMARALRLFGIVDAPSPAGSVQHRAMPDVQHSIEQVRLIRKAAEDMVVQASTIGALVGGRR